MPPLAKIRGAAPGWGLVQADPRSAWVSHGELVLVIHGSDLNERRLALALAMTGSDLVGFRT